VLAAISQNGERAVSISLPWQSLTDREMLAALRDAMSGELPEDASIFLELLGLDSLQDTRQIAKAMRGLREHGYRFIICTFDGAPVPKLVQGLPADLLRVQQNLVSEIPDNRFTLELLTSLIRVLHSIGVGTIADDVSSGLTLRALREAGIDYVRGNQIGRAKLASTLLRQLQAPPKAA
jgi:EAL domain-containing protein (putative c-di-GMP-specific phosphodiesterase class I)